MSVRAVHVPGCARVLPISTEATSSQRPTRSAAESLRLGGDQCGKAIQMPLIEHSPETGIQSVRSEEGALDRHSAEWVVVHDHAPDTTVFSQGARLRSDHLSSKHTAHGREGGIPIQELEVTGQLLHSINIRS